MAGSCLGLGALVEKAGMIENSRLQTRVQVPLGSCEEFKGIRVQLLNFPLHISLQLFFFFFLLPLHNNCSLPLQRKVTLLPIPEQLLLWFIVPRYKNFHSTTQKYNLRDW